MAGNVYVNELKVQKAGENFDEAIEIEVRGKAIPYVSRGGLKLEKAIRTFPLDLNDKVCIDIGASTGGFTDCMLKNGARKVFAIDVGYGQLAWELRKDPRVICMERTNIRKVEPENIGESVDFCSIDVSFISLTLVLPVAKSLMKEDGEIVCLVKPQFEAGREQVGKKGVIKDINVHKAVLQKIYSWCEKNGLCVKAVDFSPVKGPEGNIEYLMYLTKGEMSSGTVQEMIEQVTMLSHRELD